MKNIDTICKAVAVFSFSILAASSSPAAVLFSQPFNESGNYYGAVGYPNVYDDFTIASGGTISKVDWSGIDPDNDITGFTVNFYSDNGGSPGTELSTTPITGTAGETASGSDMGPYPINNYSATLPTAFTASPATEYFIQIVGTSSGPGGFYWQTSGQGNDGAISGTSPLETNLAFALEGTPVPEPNTIDLSLLGTMAFLVRRPWTKS